MVSRSTGPLRTILPAVAVGLAALLVGCAAGQVTQTDSIEPAVNGNRGDVGDIALRDVMLAYPESGEYREGDEAPLVLTIVSTGDTDDELLSVSSPAAPNVELLGNTSLPARTRLQVVVPEEPVAESSAAPSTTETSETSPSEPSEPSEPAEPTDSSAPGTGESSEPGEPSGSEAPSSEGPASSETSVTATLDEVGTMSIVLTGLVQDLPMGRNVPVTFVFANAGQITINLPIAAPATARPEAPETEEEGGH